MKTESNNHDARKFITILADGKFHESVEDGTPGSVVREYEDSKTGEMKQKVELVHESVSGIITNVSFHDGEFGKSIQIELDGDGVVSVGVTSTFGEDFMKKLPAIKLDKEVKLTPYSFEAEGKTRKGITVYQDGEKVESFYYDKEAKKAINGLPQPEGDTAKYDSEDWKMHFMVVRKFLIKQVEALFPPKFEPTNEKEADAGTITLEDL